MRDLYRDDTLADLARSGLDARDAKCMGIEDVTAEWCEENVSIPRDGYKIPYPGSDHYRVRFTQFTPPEHVAGKDYFLDEQRYTQPVGTGVCAYVPALTNLAKLLDGATITINIVEGEKKAFVMSKAGFVTIGIGGVDCFRRDGKLLEVLIKLAAGGRRINIVFDNDRTTNPNIVRAEVALAIELRAAGARVFIAAMPKGELKGADDYIVAKGAKAFKAILDTALPFGSREVVAGIRKTKRSNQARHRIVADAITADLKATGRFIRTEEGLFYFDDVSKTLISLESEKSRELRAYIDARYGVTAACPEWAFTFERLADTAFTEGDRATVHKLSHFDSKAGIWYRSKSPSELFRATVKGWTIVDNGADGVLIHTRGSMADVEVNERPSGRAAFDSVVGVPNFINGYTMTAKQSRLLWGIYIVALNFSALLPTRPIPLKSGEKGAGKTSGDRAVLRTEFGPRGQVTTLNPKKIDALESVVVNDSIAVLDNIDGKHAELQNMLAVAATGGTYKCRTLYTTMQKSEFRIDCFLMATSRDPKSFVRDDVVDRLLYFQVGRRDDFRPEGELISSIDANRPKYWRWMLDTMPDFISALQSARPGAIHDDRMADFAKFACAVGPVLGYPVSEVRDALAAMRAEKLHFQSEYSPVVGAIRAYVEDQEMALVNFSGKDGKAYENLRTKIATPMTAADLLAAIKTVRPDFPFMNPRSFGQALRDDAAAIEAECEFRITEDKKRKVKMYSIAPSGGYLAWKNRQKGPK